MRPVAKLGQGTPRDLEPLNRLFELFLSEPDRILLGNPRQAVYHRGTFIQYRLCNGQRILRIKCANFQINQSGPAVINDIDLAIPMVQQILNRPACVKRKYRILTVRYPRPDRPQIDPRINLCNQFLAGQIGKQNIGVRGA